MPNGECPIGAGLSKEVARNTSDIRVYKRELGFVDERVDKLMSRFDRFAERVNANFRVVNWILGVFTVVMTALLITYFTKLIWGV